MYRIRIESTSNMNMIEPGQWPAGKAVTVSRLEQAESVVDLYSTIVASENERKYIKYNFSHIESNFITANIQ